MIVRHKIGRAGVELRRKVKRFWGENSAGVSGEKSGVRSGEIEIEIDTASLLRGRKSGTKFKTPHLGTSGRRD